MKQVLSAGTVCTMRMALLVECTAVFVTVVLTLRAALSTG
jgi:hypothetical protein